MAVTMILSATPRIQLGHCWHRQTGFSMLANPKFGESSGIQVSAFSMRLILMLLTLHV